MNPYQLYADVVAAIALIGELDEPLNRGGEELILGYDVRDIRLGNRAVKSVRGEHQHVTLLHLNFVGLDGDEQCRCPRSG